MAGRRLLQRAVLFQSWRSGRQPRSHPPKCARFTRHIWNTSLTGQKPLRFPSRLTD